jgi:hypothetical protein
MTRILTVTLLAATLVAASPQAPSIQNGRLETRQANPLDRELATLVAGATDPMWAGWRVPIADGQRGGCCTYSDDWTNGTGIRGCFVEPNTTSVDRQLPALAQPPGPVSLEAGSGLVILLRLVDHHIERLRTFGDDCPLDAGGRTVYWLQGVGAPDSLKFLEGLLRSNPGMTPAIEQRVSESALSAIALHRDAGADAILDRMATADTETSLRRSARAALGSARGAHGFTVLRQLIEAEHLPEIRRQLVSALGATRQPGTADALLAIAKRDSEAKVRAEAVYWVPQRGGQRVVADIVAIIDNDSSDDVKQRAVRGLARLPAEDGVPLLIQIARTSKSPVVKKEAVSALSQSKDARALAFLETLLK